MEMEEEQTNDLAADLSAAWDAAEAEADDVTDSEVPESEEHEPQLAAGEDGEHEPEVQPEGEPSGLRRAAGEEESPAQAGDQPSLDAPPKAFSPEAREAWKDTPEAVRKELAKREADYAYGIEKHRANTERVRQMDKTLSPYQQFFAMNGGAPNVLPGLLQAGASLQMGSQVQKVQTVAKLIKQFDVDISKLDDALVGNQVKPDPNEQLQSLVQQQIAPLQQKLMTYEQREQMEQQQRQQKVAQDVQSFGQTHEFFNDVRPAMADLMDMAANRGREMTLEEAYEIACQSSPEIRKVIESRKAQEQVASKRRAASSVRGSPGASAMSTEHDSRRALIAEQWDNFGRV